MPKLILTMFLRINVPIQLSMIAILCIYLSACSSIYKTSDNVNIATATQLNISTVPLAMFGHNWQQVLHVSKNDDLHTLLAQLEINNNGTIKLVVMTAQGLPILKLEKANQKPLLENKMINGIDINPEYILAEIALVHWPLSFLKSTLSGADIEQKGKTRYVIKDGRRIIIINYTDNKTELINTERHYHITFEKV